MVNETENPGASGSADTRATLGTLGRYVLRQELASGGMATVYLAHLSGPHGFEKAVALKRIHPHLAKDRRFVEMFLDEARVAGLIHHPNVCTLVDFGEEGGVPYLVLEYLNGESMASVIAAARESGDAPRWLFARIVHDAARGLHAAHQLTGPDGRPLHVVHRDVSPQNIFVLYDGLTKVVDFGVARARGRLSVTQSNEVKGKLAFMSPEQYDNVAIDQRTDIWALGVVLWESTVGRRLFRTGSDAATIAAVLNKPVPRPSDLDPDYPPALESIVMRCLEREVSRRFESADQLADALEEYLYSLGKPVGASQVKRWMHEHFQAEIAHRAALLRGEPAPPLPTRDTRSTEVANHPDEGATVPAPNVGHDLPTVVSRKGTPPQPVPALEPEPVAETPSTGPIPTPASEPTEGARRIDRRASRRARIATILVLSALAGAAFVILARTLGGGPAGTTSAERDAGAGPSRAVTGQATVRATELPSPAPSAPSAPAPSGPAAAPAAVLPVEAPRDAGVPVEPQAPEVTPRARIAAPPRAPVERGRLNLMAVPPARVRIDGRSVGETPLLGHSLTVGDHRVELVTADGQRRVVEVRVRAGELTRQSVRF